MKLREAPDFSEPVSGPAYTRGFRAIATAILLAVIAMAMRAWLNLGPSEQQNQTFSMLTLGLAVLAGSYWFLVRSQTVIDAQGLRQSGLMDKKVDWNEIMVARMGGFWISRRLVVRTTRGRFRAFYGGTPQLLAAFERIAAAFPRR